MENEECIICFEKMSEKGIADPAFALPCSCAAIVCVWCWKKSLQQKVICVHCRQIYQGDRIEAMNTFYRWMMVGQNLPKFKNLRVLTPFVVFVKGFPNISANEDLLPGMDWFGQYGEVENVTFTIEENGTRRIFSDGTCEIYVRFSTEHAVARCVPSVHNFMLNGQLLQAYVGTNKYCWNWLQTRNCTAARCMFMHEFAAEEDSFRSTKAVKIRHRLLNVQITGPRVGNTLPPPVVQ